MTKLEYLQYKLETEISCYATNIALKTDADNYAVLDVREAIPTRERAIPGSILIPLEELSDRLNELPKDKKLIVVCWNVTCGMGVKALITLVSAGYDAMELKGGFDTWEKMDYPTEKI